MRARIRSRLSSIVERLEARQLLSVGSPYVVPSSPATTISQDPGWKFQFAPSGTPQAIGFNDSAWASVSLPHTYDGATTGIQTGDGWYRKTINVPAGLAGQQLFLQFEGAYLVSTVYVDGVQVGAHSGGFNGFDIDVTNTMTPGASHLVAVDVNNNGNTNIVPANGGDYTKQGGLYRDVSLIAVSPAHVAITEPAPAGDSSGSLLAGAGVYFSNSTVTIGAVSANISVKTVLDNASALAASVDVTSYLVDAAGVIQSQQISTQALSAGQKTVAVTQGSSVTNPHLWNGRIDPYLYDLYVEVRDHTSNQLLDLSHKQVGIRSFNINAATGFFLNGQVYKLVGVNVHQDSGMPSANGGFAGWAQTDAQIQAGLDMVLDLGATVIRTAHYPNNQAVYDYCDKTGLMVYTEFGMVNNVTSGTAGSAFLNNAEDQLTEMVQQNYNHPSIFAWGLFNEIGENATSDAALTALNSIAKNLDTTGRYTAAASNQGSTTSGINTIPDIVGRHYYDGWYSSSPEQMGPDIDGWHNGNPTDPMGVTEYGGGASAYQYTTSTQFPAPNPNGEHLHSANQQSQLFERQWAQISTRSYLWADIVWQMFDMSSGGRNEGDTQGVNDKGLVTRDHVKKDSYYYYQAAWNNPARAWANQKVLYISDHGWNDRPGASITVTAYSNMGAPTLTLNGISQGTMVAKVVSGVTIPDAYTINIVLAAGANSVQVSRSYNAQTYTDSVSWSYHAAALSGSSFARVDFTDSAGNLQAGYTADLGAAFNGTLGWTTTSHSATPNTAGTYNRTSPITAPFDQIDARTGIMLPTNRLWEYALPNGVYDVHVVAADSTNPGMVNNLTVEGFAVHDVDYTTDFTLKDNGFDEFYAKVLVSDGRLTLAAGQGSWAPRLAYVDINVIDATPPQIVGTPAFSYQTGVSIAYTFTENVQPSLSVSDFNIQNLTTNTTVSDASKSLSYNSGSNVATLTLAGAPSDGNYHITVASTDVTDVAGNPLTSGNTFDFFMLMGDTDHNRTVDVADLGNLSTNYGITSGATYAMGDFDYNGKVDVSDLGDLASNYGTTLAAVGPSASSPAGSMLAASTASVAADAVAGITPHAPPRFAPRAAGLPFSSQPIKTWSQGFSSEAGTVASSLKRLIDSLDDLRVVAK